MPYEGGGASDAYFAVSSDMPRHVFISLPVGFPLVVDRYRLSDRHHAITSRGSARVGPQPGVWTNGLDRSIPPTGLV